MSAQPADLQNYFLHVLFHIPNTARVFNAGAGAKEDLQPGAGRETLGRPDTSWLILRKQRTGSSPSKLSSQPVFADNRSVVGCWRELSTRARARCTLGATRKHESRPRRLESQRRIFFLIFFFEYFFFSASPETYTLIKLVCLCRSRQKNSPTRAPLCLGSIPSPVSSTCMK